MLGDKHLIGPCKCLSACAAPLKLGRDMMSSPHPASAAGPEPDGDPGNDSAGMDCTASPLVEWMDTMKRENFTSSLSGGNI